MTNEPTPNPPPTRPVIVMSGGWTTQGLWQPLSEHYDICLAHPQMSQQLADMGLPGFGLQKYGNAEIQETAINVAYEMADKVRHGMGSVNGVVSEAFGGDVPENLQPEYTNKWWPSMVGEHLRNEAIIVQMLEALVNERKVVGCLVHEDVTPDARTIVLWCKSHGVPTIHVPHANCFYTGDGWDIHTESISDYIAASGEHEREFYTHWEYSKWSQDGRIRLCGVPQLDGWCHPEDNKPSRWEARRVLGIILRDADGNPIKDVNGEEIIDMDSFLLIYASSWEQLTNTTGGFAGQMEESLRQAFEAAKELGAILCIKMHPGEAQGTEQVYLNALQQYAIPGFVTRQFNEYVIMAATEGKGALLSHGPSNICISAAMVGVPSAYMAVDDFQFPFPGPIAVHPGGNATHAIKMAMQLDKSKTWDLFSKNCNDAWPNGNAKERIVEFVREVCSPSQ